MIIPDDAPLSPAKDTPPTLPPGSTSRAQDPLPPPAYGSAETYRAPNPSQPQSYPARPYYDNGTANVNIAPVNNRRYPAAERFLKAFFVALVIWALFAMFLRSLGELNRWTHRHGTTYQQVAIPSNVNVQNCASWSGGPSAQFDLPVSSDLLMFMARGHITEGSIEIVSSSRAGNTVKVDVAASVSPRSLLNQIKVCVFKLKEGENGVGIFTPLLNHGSSGNDRLGFNVKVTLPASLTGSPLDVKHLQTDLPDFSQTLGDLQKSVIFRALSLKSSNGRIKTKSVNADNATLQTSNAPIEGSYATSNSLSLTTSNGPIKVDVELTNDPKNRATSLNMKTSNEALVSNIVLTSTKSTGGKFDVEGKTSNGLIDVNFKKTPAESDLKLQATSSNGPAKVEVDAAYEGTFTLTTSEMHASVQRTSAKDPLGQGRTRDFAWNPSRKGGDGSVQWHGGSQHGKGDMKVKTSNGPITFTV